MRFLHSGMGFFEMAIKLYYLSLGLRLPCVYTVALLNAALLMRSNCTGEQGIVYISQTYDVNHKEIHLQPQQLGCQPHEINNTTFHHFGSYNHFAKAQFLETTNCPPLHPSLTMNNNNCLPGWVCRANVWAVWRWTECVRTTSSTIPQQQGCSEYGNGIRHTPYLAEGVSLDRRTGLAA